MTAETVETVSLKNQKAILFKEVKNKPEELNVPQFLPLVLISGIMCNEKLWKKQLESASKDLIIIVPNIVQDKSISALASEIIQTAGSKFNVVGFSSGGYIAQEIIRQNPSVINKLVLMNTAGGEYSKKQQTNRSSFIQLCETKGSEKALEEFVKKANSTYSDNQINIKEPIAQMMKEIDSTMFYKQFKHVYEYNKNAAKLQDIRCPVLVIVSDNDPFISKESYQEMQSLIPDVKLELIKGGGHMLPISNPTEINTVLENFFEYPKLLSKNQQSAGMSYV